jgi:hypothetical protein
MSGFGGNPFNFKELSMKKSSSDYFNMKPIRGSSPTASLAADLSQNFHIDQRYVEGIPWVVSWSKGQSPANSIFSPQLATPRRSLFTASMLGQTNGRGK